MNEYKRLADLLADPQPGLSSWCNAMLEAQRAIGFAPARKLPDRGAAALMRLLTRIGSWTCARWDQHLRDEIGDDDADEVIAWVNANIKRDPQ